MKHKFLKQAAIILAILLCTFQIQAQVAQVTLPPNFTQIAQANYNNLPHKEVSFEVFLEGEIRNYTYQYNLANGLAALYNGCDESNTICGNGDFETGVINPSEWDGAFGVLVNGEADPTQMTEGFSTDVNITSTNSHQTIVNAGFDPNVSTLSTVAPGGSTRALRIGNSAVNNGTELISKRITVGAQTIINFMYAVVLQSPNHTTVNRPAFWVRVVNCATGQEIPGTVNLGNGISKIIGDASDPFLQSAAGGSIAFRNWSCGQINLSAVPAGTNVNIQFITEDCAQTGHFGYAYIDNLCGTCALIGGGALSLGSVTDCGPGRICMNYTLQQINNTTGTLQLTLQTYQNGVLLQTTPSPVLTSGSSYCFNVNPTAIPGINTSLTGFDYVVTGNFNVNGFITQSIIGNPPTGQVNGQNNDYQIYCIDQCCPGRNLVRNPGFEQGNQSFLSSYNYEATVAPNSVLTGEYAVITSAQGLTVSPTWNVNCVANGRHLYVNGATGLTGTRTVWSQNVNVQRGKFYKFCADMKNLPQCGFDVKPRVNVQFSIPGGYNLSNQLIDVPAGSCNWQSVNQVIATAAGAGFFSMNITITLDETGIGDGNDLAIDNITLVEIPQVDQADLMLNVNIINLAPPTFGVSVEPVSWPVPRNCGYYWEVEEMDDNYNVIPGTAVYNPSQWWGVFPNTFTGYDGTDILNGTNDGIFQIDRKYRIVYGRWCECEAWNSTSWIYDPKNAANSGGGIKFIKEEGHTLSPKDIMAIMNGHTANRQPDANKAVEKGKQPASKQESAQKMKVFPNPTDGKLSVLLPSAYGEGSISIINMQGTEMMKITLAGKQPLKEIDTNSLTPGSYIILYKSISGEIVAREKFVKL